MPTKSAFQAKNRKQNKKNVANNKVLFTKLDKIIEKFGKKRGALIPILQSAQDIFTYLPEEVLKHISIKLNIPYSEITGVVSFYSYFSTQPRGKNIIRVCLGTACYVRGGKEVLDNFKQALGVDVGETTKDGMFTLEAGYCFGACALAPVVMINEEVYQRVRPGKVREIVEAYYNKVEV